MVYVDYTQNPTKIVNYFLPFHNVVTNHAVRFLIILLGF
jgi:hypothetical protein